MLVECSTVDAAALHEDFLVEVRVLSFAKRPPVTFSEVIVTCYYLVEVRVISSAKKKSLVTFDFCRRE